MQKVTLPAVARQGDPLMGPKIRQHDIEQAAQQFEAIFLRNLMKQMRKTNELFESKDDPMNSESGRMMQSFYDDELCNQLAAHHGGIGLAAMIVKQLSRGPNSSKI